MKDASRRRIKYSRKRGRIKDTSRRIKNSRKRGIMENVKI